MHVHGCPYIALPRAAGGHPANRQGSAWRIAPSIQQRLHVGQVLPGVRLDIAWQVIAQASQLRHIGAACCNGQLLRKQARTAQQELLVIKGKVHAGQAGQGHPVRAGCVVCSCYTPL